MNVWTLFRECLDSVVLGAFGERLEECLERILFLL